MNICRFIQKYAYISYYGKGVSEVMKKMRMKSLLKMTFSLILSMIMAVMMNITAMAVVIDVSSHDGLIDWNSVDEHIEGVIIRKTACLSSVNFKKLQKSKKHAGFLSSPFL